MLKDHLPCHSTGGAFPTQKYFYLLFIRHIFLPNFVACFFAFSHHLSTLFFIFTFSVSMQVVNIFFLTRCLSCQNFLLYSQSSLWLVLTVLTVNIFSFISRAALFASLFYIILLTSSDRCFGISVFSAASLYAHFFLCKWRCWVTYSLMLISRSSWTNPKVCERI